MKILSSDYEKKEFKLEIQNNDDFWYLSQFLEFGDVVGAKTQRKIKIGDGDNAKVIKKWVYLDISIEKLEFHKYSGDLRLSGKVVNGTDDIPSGKYHTINVSLNLILDVKKKVLYKYQIDKLEESQINKEVPILISYINRGEVVIAQLKKYGYEVLNEYSMNVASKHSENISSDSFFSDAVDLICNYEEQKKIDFLIIASPSIWKSDISKLFSKKALKARIIYAECNGSGTNAISEVIKRPETKDALKKERACDELNIVEELLANISRGSLYGYGFSDVENKANMGAVESLIISENFLKAKRENGSFAELEAIMKIVEMQKGHISIIQSDTEASTKLDSLSGIAALLRFDVD